MENDAPIFVRGLSRSGGTLVVTLLDAHNSISMSYEQYPNLLISETPIDLTTLAFALDRAKSLKVACKTITNNQLRIFLIRCDRGGLDNHDVAELVRKLVSEGRDFDSTEGRMRMIHLCGRRKMF